VPLIYNLRLIKWVNFFILIYCQQTPGERTVENARPSRRIIFAFLFRTDFRNATKLSFRKFLRKFSLIYVISD